LAFSGVGELFCSERDRPVKVVDWIPHDTKRNFGNREGVKNLKKRKNRSRAGGCPNAACVVGIMYGVL